MLPFFEKKMLLINFFGVVLIKVIFYVNFPDMQK